MLTLDCSTSGGPSVFNPFLRDYIDHFKYKTVNTSDFKDFLYKYFKDRTDVLDTIDWKAWLHAPGMPPVNVVEMYDQTYAGKRNDIPGLSTECDRTQ